MAISDRYHMELTQLETFLAVRTYGGFRRAAVALRVTQPAVSARIKALEASLGAPLFERGRGGLTPSDAARALRPHAEQVLRAVALARQAVHRLRPASAGALEIAAALSICAYLLPDVLKRFQAAAPRVFVTVRSGHSKEVLEMVLRGEAELGLARSLHHPAVDTLSLGDDPLLLVQHRAHPLVPARRARLEEVADRPLVFYDRGSSDWTLTHGLFRRAGLVPNVTLEVETIETAKRMVERGLGLAFLPHLAVARELRRGALVALEIVDAEPLRRSLDVVRARHRAPSPEALAFLDALRAAVRDVAASGGSRPGAGRRAGTRPAAPGSGRSRSRRRRPSAR
ncbi:MAG TPA: LysR family transcriptional regulator [Methylomirabilota bacterium]|jgi:DNA-binding transcriptional LysR family regulator|nr:LysR family transcriptional regulator [Methylomirabilota bacterium]